MITEVPQASIAYLFQSFEKPPGKSWCLESVVCSSKKEAEFFEQEIRALSKDYPERFRTLNDGEDAAEILRGLKTLWEFEHSLPAD